MTASWLLDGLVAALVLGAAAWTLAAPTAVAAVVGFLGFGLLLTLAWLRLGAAEVAMAEAAIGVAATGVILLLAVVRLRGGAETVSAAMPGRGMVAAAGLLAGAVGLALALAVLALPDPAPGLAAEALARRGEAGLGNPVAAVLTGYRGLDRLLESVALVLAVLAVWSMAPDRRWGGIPGPRFPRQEDGPLALLARLLPPVGIVVGTYIAWVGSEAPGGTVQGGAILAAMWGLAWVAGIVQPPAIASRPVRLALVAGPAAFLLAGLAGMALAEGFLAWPPAFARPLILLVEAAMTLSVAAALALLVAGPPERAA
ncbi:MnhB domain-containing protein [Roseicella aerolata]|uniref:MnhB domain-containing protein n=1 Tax=Roseicella aerolata TaxID=2883479 RepID=A0A9X1IJJ0_9PROT|nr:MnhB domain-containing protein [Roseicella aerolata]MCB4824793.1 MnhB domain-containing protein [Roseicella aerolata]